MSPLHFNLTDRGTSPAAGQRPGIDKVHGTAVPRSGAGVSICKVVVVAMGAISTAISIAERDGPRISCPNHGQSPQDGGDGQNVDNLNGFFLAIYFEDMVKRSFN